MGESRKLGAILIQEVLGTVYAVPAEHNMKRGSQESGAIWRVLVTVELERCDFLQFEHLEWVLGKPRQLML